MTAPSSIQQYRAVLLSALIVVSAVAIGVPLASQPAAASHTSEDFTTYTEEDPNGYITIHNSDEITWSNLPTSSDADVYTDVTEHDTATIKYAANISSGSAGGDFTYVGTLSEESYNTTGSLGAYVSGWVQYDTDDGGTNIGIESNNNKTPVASISSTSTDLYVTMEVDQGAGEATMYVYSDADRTDLLGSKTVTIDTGTYDMLHAVAGYNDSGSSEDDSGAVKNLDYSSKSGSEDLSGVVEDQNGNRVADATVKVVSFAYEDFDGSLSEKREKVDNIRENISDPTPPQFDPDRTLDTFENDGGYFASIDSGHYVAMHSPEQWVGEKWVSGPSLNPVSGDDTLTVRDNPLVGVQQDGTGGPKIVAATGDEQVFSCWDAEREGAQNPIDRALPGAQEECRIAVTRLDAGGANMTEPTTLTPQPHFRVRGVLVAGFGGKTHHAVSVDLAPGFYRIHPVGEKDTAYVVAVAPNGDVSQLTQSIKEDLKRQNQTLTERANELESYLNNRGNATLKTTSTNSTGHWTMPLPPETDEVDLIAYRKPPGMDASHPTQANITGYYSDTIDNFKEEPESALELNQVCGGAASEAGGFHTPAGRTHVEDIPQSGVTVNTREVALPDNLPPIDLLCANRGLLQQLLNNGLEDLIPGVLQDLDTLSEAELRQKYKRIARMGNNSPAVCRRVAAEFDSVSSAECPTSGGGGGVGGIGGGGGSAGDAMPDPDNVSTDTLRNLTETIIQTVETQPNDGRVSEPSVDVGEDAVTITWETDYDDLEPDEVTLRLHGSDGTTEILTPNSSYLSIEPSAVGGDDVVLQDYPLNSTDAAVLNAELDVVRPSSQSTQHAQVRNPTFDGEIPSLDAVTVSDMRPGPDERVTACASGADSFGGVGGATAYAPNGTALSTSTTDAGCIAFDTAGAGTHHVLLNVTNPAGKSFTVPVRVAAGESDIAAPPSIRATRGPLGEYAIASDLQDAEIQVRQRGTHAIVAAYIASDADVPDRLHAYTQELDLAADSTTTIRILRGQDGKEVRQRSRTLLHRTPFTVDDAVLYRESGEPLLRGGSNQYGSVIDNDENVTLATYTTARGSVDLHVNTRPGYVERAVYRLQVEIPVDLDLPTMPGAMGGPGLIPLGLLGIAGYARRRRGGAS